MNKELIKLPEMKLMGISIRTNNREEVSPGTAKILGCAQRYFQEHLADKTPHRKRPGTTFCAYTNYESDHTGDYTYFIGEQVSDFSSLPTGLETLVIPEQSYVKFTNGPGAMPEVVREPWFAIWDMSPEELGGTRAYLTDFEVYDERAADPEKVILDIYIGLKS
jgi:predicted transcriptional regulator YdeE